jgi:GT2 family glycosyltransferase
MRFVPTAHVAVVIPVHNRLAYTDGIIAQLRQLEYDEALVVVVDDGSTDGTSQHLQNEHPDVVVLPGTGDLWWSGAVNVGCRFAIEQGSTLLVLFNNDNVRLSPNCVDELARCVDHFGGCASSVVLEENGGSPHRIRNAGGTLTWPSRGIMLREEGAEYDPTRGVVECDWLGGMSLAFSSSLFTELDGFDERQFPQYRGDTDFTLRARLRGKPCVVSYDCWVSNDMHQTGLHFHSRVSLKAFVAGLVSLKSNYQIRSVMRFTRRYCPPRFIPIHLALFYMRYVYATLKTWVPNSLRRVGSR